MNNKRSIPVFLFVFSLCLLLNARGISAQTSPKSDLQLRAEDKMAQQKTSDARSLFIQAFGDYVRKGQLEDGVQCGVKATALYYQDNAYQEAFDLLRTIDQTIASDTKLEANRKSAMRYLTSKERMSMYIKLRKSDRAGEQVDIMEKHANASADEDLKTDFLYNKAIYCYTFGQSTKGDVVFKEMSDRLTAQKQYDKIETVYKTLIANGRKSGNAHFVAKAYDKFIEWKDSVTDLKFTDEKQILQQHIDEQQASIEEKDSSLAARWRIIMALCTLAIALAVVLILGGLLLTRFIYLNRKQKATIRMANENLALKAHFIHNISDQMQPALNKLDGKIAEVKALQDFTSHIQTLSQLEENIQEIVELEDIPIQPFCGNMADNIRDNVKSGVSVTVDAPQMNAMINKEYVSHVLQHLLYNAAKYTPEGGHIRLEFKKRGAHTHQFLVSNTGTTIPAEQREELFKPFRDIKDLTNGDGLGLPICQLMAMKMNGQLTIDPEFSKGTRFILTLHT